MALHDDLLDLARRLVPPVAPPHAAVPPLPPILEADLRRGVSTAYYALFHLFIHEAMARIVADPALRSRVGRSLDHGKMKLVCQGYSAATVVVGLLTVRPGVVIAPQLRDIGTAFVDLQQATHDADYDTATPLGHPDADLTVMTAENAFLDWAACQADPSSGVFLTDLFLKCVLKRS
jgi:hypothetical protein